MNMRIQSWLLWAFGLITVTGILLPLTLALGRAN